MDALFLERLHGASTHLPIVLPPISVVLDFLGRRTRDERSRPVYHRMGMTLAVTGVAGSFVAIAAGLAMSGGKVVGSGMEKLHHLFVWPAFALIVILMAWRLLTRLRFTPRTFSVYFVGMSLGSTLMVGAAYWGGEMVLHAGPIPVAGATNTASATVTIDRGHDLFLMNCAHCHGDDARGTEEGPDLTRFHKSDARIASVVKNGIKGEMPRFDKKLGDDDVAALIQFIRSLKVR